MQGGFNTLNGVTDIALGGANTGIRYSPAAVIAQAGTGLSLGIVLDWEQRYRQRLDRDSLRNRKCFGTLVEQVPYGQWGRHPRHAWVGIDRELNALLSQSPRSWKRWEPRKLRQRVEQPGRLIRLLRTLAAMAWVS